MKSRQTVRTVAASVILSGILAVTAASVVARASASTERPTVNIRSADVTLPLPTDTTLATVPLDTTTVPDTTTTVAQTTTTAAPVTVPVTLSVPIPVPVETVPAPRGSPRGGGGFVARAVPNAPQTVAPAAPVVTEAPPPPTVWVPPPRN